MLDKQKILDYNESLSQKLKDIKFCFCGSWKLYTDCCGNKTVPEWLSSSIYHKYLKLEKDTKKPLWNKLWEVKKLLKNSRCICSNCNDKAINSHFYPRNHLQRFFWNHVWILSLDGNMNVVPDKKGVGQVAWSIWCKNHDSSLFQLTDKSQLQMIADLQKSENKKHNQRYIQEFCYKFFWVFKVHYMIRQKVFYLWLFFNDYQEVDFMHFKSEYIRYNSICNLYLSEEKLRNEGVECERRYYMLNSNIQKKVYFSAPIFSSDGSLPYVLYVYPHWWKFCCIIMRTLDCDSRALKEFFQEKIKSKELRRLNKLINWTLWVDFIW